MKKFASKLVSLIKSKKKVLLFASICILIFSLISVSSIFVVSNFRFNIADSLAEISENFKKESNSQVYSLIYPKETTSYENTVYRDSEKSAQIRSMHSGIECFDAYLNHYNEKYTYFKYSFSDGTTCDPSLIMFPKNSFIQSKFTYDINLICGTVGNISGINDIFIYQDFADALIEKKDFYGVDNYTGLIDKKIVSHLKISSINKNFDYTIKGVIKNDSTYLKYKDLFGDFCICSEYLVLPCPCVTYFELFDNKYENVNLFRNILKIYNYNVKYSNIGVGERVFPIEYRSYLYSKNNATNSTNITNIYNAKVDSLYNYYFNKQNLLPLIIFSILLLVAICSLYIFNRHYSRYSKTKLFVLLLLSYPFGLFFSFLYKLIAKPVISLTNPFSLILYLFIFLIFCLCKVFFERLKNENSYN